MNDKLLERIHAISLEILEALDKALRGNGIEYTAAYGTMLGAVRHGGFIPWDDDIDLIMTKENYDKFLAVCDDILPDYYKVERAEVNPEYPFPFAKVVDTRTTFIEADFKKLDYNKGVSVDIFPAYRVRDDEKVIKSIARKNRINAIFRSAYDGSIISRCHGLKKACMALVHVAAKCVGLQKLNMKMKKRMEREHAKGGALSMVEYAFTRTVPYSVYENLRDYAFDGLTVRGVTDYDGYLTAEFGDYMTLPPLDKRECHVDKTSYIDLDCPCDRAAQKKIKEEE